MNKSVEAILAVLIAGVEAERLELRAWLLFREAAMSDPSITLEMCDIAWETLKAKARRMHASKLG